MNDSFIREQEEGLEKLFHHSRPTISFNRPPSDQPFVAYIDHTYLKPETSSEDILLLCQQAKKYSVYSVCVPPTWVNEAAEHLQGSSIKLCSVLSFPFGYDTSSQKKNEASMLVSAGVNDIDMVLAIGLLKSKKYQAVYEDISAVVKEAPHCYVKVILEMSLLSEEEKVIAALIAVFAGAHFLKTSTGFGAHGAKIEDVSLLRRIAGERVGVKASGGIRDYVTAQKFIDCGADRIGCSATEKILKEMLHF